MGTQLPFPQGGAPPPIFGPYLLWPNGWMDQDATWYGGRTRPSRLCVRWGPSSPPHKGEGELETQLPLPNFRPMSIVAKQLAGSRWHLQIVGHSSPPKKGGRAPTQFSAHLYCGQTAGCIKMPLGMEVGSSQASLC